MTLTNPNIWYQTSNSTWTAHLIVIVTAAFYIVNRLSRFRATELHLAKKCPPFTGVSRSCQKEPEC